MKLLHFILLWLCICILIALTGCETIESEDGTRTTRIDAAAIRDGLGAVDHGISTFQHAQAAYRGDPQPYP